ncbi:hypothetical protein EG829_29320 [bacterium]|nr:hypothetical protein [bacterium]
MSLEELQADRNKVERTKTRIFDLFTRCIMDMEQAASSSGLTMRDLGIDVEKYTTASRACIVEMKLQM